MITPNTEAFLIVIGLESIAGLCLSAFLICHLLFISFKQQKLTSCNSILISLSISKALFTLVTSVDLLISFLWFWLYNISHIFYAICYITAVSTSSCAYFTSILCFFYFIKIRQFPPGILAWVKMRIDKLIPGMILTVILVSLLCGYLSLFIFGSEFPKNVTYNTDDFRLELHRLRVNFYSPALVLNSLAFVVELLCTIGSVGFLKQRERSAGNLGSSKVKDYRGTVHLMICLICLYALIYLVFIFNMIQLFAFKSWGYWICMMITYSHAAGQLGLIINGNPKLREVWKQLFKIRYILND